MKKLLLLLFISVKSFGFQVQGDTTVIEFVDKGFSKKISVKSKIASLGVLSGIIKEKEGMTLDAVLTAFDVEQDEREKAWVVLAEKNSKTESLVLENKAGIKVFINFVPVSTLVEDDEIRTFESFGERGKDGENGKDGSFSINIFKDNSGPRTSQETGRFFSKSDFALYLGLNGYTNQQDEGPNHLSELRMWPSRYIALSFRTNATLGNGKNVHTVLSFGPEFAWHNFVLKNSNILKYEEGQMAFVKNDKETNLSKFVVPHLNFPVMVNWGLKKQKFKFGVGGYVGYRVGGYTKEKFSGKGGKEKDRDSFGLNNLKYGLTAELGHKYRGTLFFRYDLNTLFRETQVNGGDMSAFSFGLRL